LVLIFDNLQSLSAFSASASALATRSPLAVSLMIRSADPFRSVLVHPPLGQAPSGNQAYWRKYPYRFSGHMSVQNDMYSYSSVK
jgi:hypothetical protein